MNRAGRFNVPFGRYTRPSFADPDTLRACSAALRGVSLYVGDFGCVLDEARKGDFVYFDPPYAPVSDTTDFTSYVASGFGWEEQERLAEVFATLASRGVFVMLSNSDVPDAARTNRVSAGLPRSADMGRQSRRCPHLRSGHAMGDRRGSDALRRHPWTPRCHRGRVGTLGVCGDTGDSDAEGMKDGKDEGRGNAS